MSDDPFGYLDRKFGYQSSRNSEDKREALAFHPASRYTICHQPDGK